MDRSVGGIPQLSEVYLENFKSFRRTTLPLAPFTVLIGPNASGKSNAVEALRFLNALATGRYLDDIYKDLYGKGLLRGKRDELVRKGETNFALGVTVTTSAGQMEWKQVVSVARELTVGEERLAHEGESVPTFWTEVPRPPHTLTVRYNNFARGGTKPSLLADDRQAVFAQLDTPARFTTPKAQKLIPQRAHTLRDVLGRIFFLEPRPALMRGYAAVEEEIVLDSSGQNLSAVLYEVCERQGHKEEVLDFVRYLPEGEIVAIGFIKTERNDVMVRVTERFGSREETWDAAILSDGTLRVLAVAAALYSVPEGSLVVVEEVDNGVHPSRAEALLERVRRVVEERALRVLLTTHNPALLDALPLDLYSGVVYCYRHKEEGDSRFVRLVDLPEYPALTVQDSLGRLLARRVLERAVSELEVPLEERRRRTLEWLEKWFEETTDKEAASISS